jgi:hypothetical protein
MNIIVQNKLIEEEKFKMILRENSNYYKFLNRDSDYYKEFKKNMKEKYKLRTVDKIDNVIDSIDLISKIFNV